MVPSTATATSVPVRSLPLLPQDFVPDVSHVIIGRGKKHSKHPGNLRYSTLVREEMDAYAAAENKAAKSDVISRLVTRVRATGNFVRESGKNRWSLVEEHSVRTTTAQHFRDALHSKYRSSKEMKKQKRKEDRTIDDEPVKKRSRCVSPDSSSSSPEATKTILMPNFLQNRLQQLDAMSIFANANFMSNVNFQDSNPFEPTPIRETSSVFGGYFADTLLPSAAESTFSPFDALHEMTLFHEVHEDDVAECY